MSDAAARRFRLSHEDLERLPEAHVCHPLIPASDVYLKRLSPQFGLQRRAIDVARIPPGRENFIYHLHEQDE